MNKRILSFALVLCMVLAMLPAMLLSVTAVDANTTTTATSKTYETKFEAVKGGANVPTENTTSGSLYFDFHGNWSIVSHDVGKWSETDLLDAGVDSTSTLLTNAEGEAWGGKAGIGSVWGGPLVLWNYSWHGTRNNSGDGSWGAAYGLSASKFKTTAYRYTAERSGTATILIDKVRFNDAKAQAGIGIFVNGKMVWPNDGDYYTDVTKYKALTSLTGTKDNDGITNVTDVASVANVELHAGDQVEFIVRQNNPTPGSLWSSCGIAANLTVSFTKAYDVTIFDGTNYTYTDAGVVALPATPAGYCGWDVDGDGKADYAGGSRVLLSCGLVTPVATPELITTDFYANAPVGGNGWQAGNYTYAGSKVGAFRPYTVKNEWNIYNVAGGSTWSWGEMGGGLYGNRYNSGLMQGYKFAVRDDIVKGGTSHATSAAAYQVPYTGNVTLSYAYFVGRREVNSTDAANPISYEFAIYVNNEKVWPTASAEGKTGTAGNITLTEDGWYNYTGTRGYEAGVVADEDILAVLGNPEIQITVNGGDTIYFALRNGNVTTWMAFMNPTVQYTAYDMENLVPTVTTFTTSMADHLPTYNNQGNYWNETEAQFSGNWSYIGRSTGNFGEKVLCNQASGTADSNWWLCPKHGGNVYGGDNSSPSFNGEMNHNYWGTYGAISSVPNWSAGYEYIAEATGTLDVSISNLTFKGSVAAKLAIFVNGMMVWPTAGGSYANTNDWYAITAATTDVTADAESTKNLFVKAGDTVDFLVRFSATYSDRGILFTPTVSYTQMFTAEDPYFVIANPLPRIIQPEGNELTMPDYAGEGKFLGWDVDGDGNPDYLAGQKVTLTAGMQFNCEPVTAIVPGSSPISKVPTLDNGKVTFYNNWFMGIRDVETKKFTPFNNITTAGSEAFAVMNNGMWGDDNWGGYYLKGNGMGRVAMVSGKMGRANTVASEVRYVAPYNGIATISYDKLTAIRGSESHIASNYIEMDFAVYVNGTRVFPYEGDWFSVKSEQYYQSGTYATLDAKAILDQTGAFPLDVELTAGDTISFVTRCGNTSSFMCDVVPNVTYNDVTNAPVINQASVTVKDTFDLNLYTHCNSLYEVEEIGCDLMNDNGLRYTLPMKGEMTRGKSMLYTTTADRELNLASACFTLEGISIMDITREFQVRTWVKYTNGVVEYGEPYYASVADYATAAAAYFNGAGDGNNSVTGDSDSMNTLKWQRVYAALLDYAAAVQKYFGIWGAPANTYLPDGISRLPKVEAEDVSNMTELEGAKAEVAGATVLLDSQINIMIALNVNGNAAGWRVLVDTNPNFSSPQYFRMFDVRDEYEPIEGEELPFTHIMMPLTVSAANYRTKYYFKVVDHEGKDQSGVLTYSVESYVARMHAEEPENTNLLELLDSMLVFCRAVNAVGQGNHCEDDISDIS